MAKDKLYIVNERMLKWMEYSIHTKIVNNQKEWCERIGFPYLNITQLRRGGQSFTLLQIEKAAKLVKGNMNWLWDLEPNMLRSTKPLSPMELLQQATVAIEHQLNISKILREPPPKKEIEIVNKKVNKTTKKDKKINIQ